MKYFCNTFAIVDVIKLFCMIFPIVQLITKSYVTVNYDNCISTQINKSTAKEKNK